MPDHPPTGRPRFRRHLRAEIGGNEVFLFDENGVTTLRGTAVVAISRMLDAQHDLASIVSAMPGGLGGEDVVGLVDQLVEAGLVSVEPAAPTRSGPELAWWDAGGIKADAFEQPGAIGLTVLGDCVEEGPLRSALAVAGLEVVPVGYPEIAGELPRHDTEPELDVVICADYLDPCLTRVDAAHRATGRPWLLARPSGVRAWIGPVFEPGRTGCWHCLAHRLWAHRGAEAVVQSVLGRRGPAPRSLVSVPTVATAVAHLVALEASKWLAGYRYAGQRGVWLFDSHELSGERHELRARPQCPACGDPDMVARSALRPVRLSPAQRTGAGGGGGDRTVTPADMWARFRHLISPVTGITKQVQPDPFAPGFSNSYRSGTNFSRRITGMAALRQSLRSENGGKGFTALDAEVGALCEAAERFSGTWQDDEYRLRARFCDLGARALDPRTCLLFDERQFAVRDRWNAEHSPFNHVPEPFDPELEIDWTPLWSLGSGQHRLLPSALLYFGAPRVPALFADSNGCAAGSSREDAVLQGLFELVERDAAAQWWYNRLLAPEVDLDAFADPRFREQRRNHAAIGRHLWVLDISADLGVPVMVAISRRTNSDDERILFGFGAHLDPAIALRRAVSEVNQMLGADRLDPETSDDPDWRFWARHATLANQPYLRPDRGVRPRVPADYADLRRDDIAQDVEALVAVLAQRGMETFVLDQTRPDVAIPVVRVVVPGMRSFWSRFAPGRLFDVPVEMGRLPTPTPYDELNPIPLFL